MTSILQPDLSVKILDIKDTMELKSIACLEKESMYWKTVL